MKLYWRFEDIPEIQPLTKAQRKEVWAATIGPRLCSKDTIVALLLALLIMVVFGFLGGFFLPWGLGTMVGCLVGYVPGSLLFWGYTLPRARPSIAAEIERRRELGKIA